MNSSVEIAMQKGSVGLCIDMLHYSKVRACNSRTVVENTESEVEANV